MDQVNHIYEWEDIGIKRGMFIFVDLALALCEGETLAGESALIFLVLSFIDMIDLTL